MDLQNPLYLFPTVKRSLALACGGMGIAMNIEKGLLMNPMTNWIIDQGDKNGTPMVLRRLRLGPKDFQY